MRMTMKNLLVTRLKILLNLSSSTNRILHSSAPISTWRIFSVNIICSLHFLKRIQFLFFSFAIASLFLVNSYLWVPLWQSENDLVRLVLSITTISSNYLSADVWPGYDMSSKIMATIPEGDRSFLSRISRFLKYARLIRNFDWIIQDGLLLED